MKTFVTKPTSFFHLLVCLVAPLSIFQDTTITKYDLVPKIVLMLGTLWLLWMRKKSGTTSLISGSKDTRHDVLFNLFLIYCFLESLRAALDTSTKLGANWWPIQFVMIGIACNSKMSSSPSNWPIELEQIRRTLQHALFAYLVIGNLLAIVPGNGFSVLGIEFTSQTFLLIPTVVLFPLLAISIAQDSGRNLIQSTMSYLLTLSLILQLADRAALAAVVILTVASLPFVVRRRVRSLRHLLGMCILIMVAFVGVLQTKHQEIGRLINDTVRIGQVRHLDTGVSEVRDLDRFVHLEAAVLTVSKSVPSVLFGFGFRQSGKAMTPELERLYRSDLPHLDVQSELGKPGDYKTFGLSALIVDFGLIGILLFLTLCGVIVKRLVENQVIEWSVVVLMTLAMSIAMLYKVNYLHYPLMYLALAPNGLFIFLNRLEVTSTSSSVQKN